MATLKSDIRTSLAIPETLSGFYTIPFRKSSQYRKVMWNSIRQSRHGEWDEPSRTVQARLDKIENRIVQFSCLEERHLNPKTRLQIQYIGSITGTNQTHGADHHPLHQTIGAILLQHKPLSLRRHWVHSSPSSPIDSFPKKPLPTSLHYRSQ